MNPLIPSPTVIQFRKPSVESVTGGHIKVKYELQEQTVARKCGGGGCVRWWMGGGWAETMNGLKLICLFTAIFLYEVQSQQSGGQLAPATISASVTNKTMLHAILISTDF